jgi:hypothetical protein
MQIWSYPTLTVAEMSAIVEEAHKAGRKVAAHTTTAEGQRNAIMAGVDSIEHGHGADRQDLEMMKAKGIYWVPTMGYYFYHVDSASSPGARNKWKKSYNVLDRIFRWHENSGSKSRMVSIEAVRKSTARMHANERRNGCKGRLWRPLGPT